MKQPKQPRAGWWNEGDDVPDLPESHGQGQTHDLNGEAPRQRGLWLPGQKWHAVQPPRRRLGF